MVELAQLVRASDCGSEGRGFEPHIPPQSRTSEIQESCFFSLKTKNRTKGTVLFVRFWSQSEKSDKGDGSFCSILESVGDAVACVELVVTPLPSYQFIVIALFDDSSFFHDNDYVGIPHGAESVCNDKCRSPFHE